MTTLQDHLAALTAESDVTVDRIAKIVYVDGRQVAWIDDLNELEEYADTLWQRTDDLRAVRAGWPEGSL